MLTCEHCGASYALCEATKERIQRDRRIRLIEPTLHVCDDSQCQSFYRELVMESLNQKRPQDIPGYEDYAKKSLPYWLEVEIR